VTEVAIGWFGPGDPDHPDFGSAWRGALLAVDEENAGGGYCRPRDTQAVVAACVPLRLAPAWAESPWHAGIRDLLRMVYERQVWAVIGGVDGATTHLAVQAALKSRFLLLSPGSTDVSADRANVPWLFSLPPSDEALAPILAGVLARTAAGGCAIVAAADHSSHASLVAVRRELTRRRIVPSAIIEVGPSETDLGAVAAHVLATGPRAVLVLAPANRAAGFVSTIRAAGFAGTIAGGAAVAGMAFWLAAGPSAEGVLAPWSVEAGARWDAFAAAYERRWGAAPDEAAVNGYDAVTLVVAAVRRAGLNRARIRDAVRDLAPWGGAGGQIRWNRLGRAQRPVGLGRWTGGRFVPVQ
jgi:ABC-type branched-subunit amino acid transport system substrate-binding protein